MPVLSDGKTPKMIDGKLAKDLRIATRPKYVNENSALLVNCSKDKEDIKKILRIIDEQDAVNRYKWYNLPCDITSNELERLLYFRGNICFFYMEERDKFYFMPYALEGTIDFYGRFNHIHPLPFSNGQEDEKSSRYKSQLQLLSQLKLKVIKQVVDEEEVDVKMLTKSAVILRDYTNQLAQVNIPRSVLNEPILNMMGDYFPFLTTNLLMGTGISSIRVQDSTEKDEVKKVSMAVYDAALSKNPYVAMTGKLDFQELTGGARNKAEDYLMAFQSLDNFRLSTLGIANGGIFEKKAHILESENAINNSVVLSSFQDGLKLRQDFCDIVNSIWGLDIWCEPSEASLGMDQDGDGDTIDEGGSQEVMPPAEGANQREGGVE